MLLKFKRHECVKSHDLTVEKNSSPPPPKKNPTDWEDTGYAVLRSLRNKADVPQLPEYLTELYEEICKKIPCGKEKIKLAEILLANKNAFAQNKTDVGTCSIITYKIDTGGAVLIRQPVRRTPHGFEMEEEKYLIEQLRNGIIKPSKSTWASPVVLVRKKV